jgi:putative hydrolase of the HAD superfamily
MKRECALGTGRLFFPMITAVCFDLWETLLTETAERSRRTEQLRLRRMEEVLSARGFEAAAERIDLAYRQLWQRCHDLYWSADHDVPCRRQIEHFLEALALDSATFDEPALAALEDAYAYAALEILPATVEGAAQVLRQLRSNGLRLGLISNTGRTPGYALRPILERLELGPFDVMVFSNEHGRCKPQPSIFEELTQALGVSRGEGAFVGDNLYADVLGSQRAGMHGIHFDPPVKGAAVAPPVDHGQTIVPDATIRALGELPAVVEELSKLKIEN